MGSNASNSSQVTEINAMTDEIDDFIIYLKGKREVNVRIGGQGAAGRRGGITGDQQIPINQSLLLKILEEGGGGGMESSIESLKKQQKMNNATA